MSRRPHCFVMDSGQPPLVLVVEDEEIIRMLAADALLEAGFEVVEAAHGEAALAVLRERANDIQAVFTDVRMPGSIDGLELAETVSRQWPWVGLLVASGHARPGRADLPHDCRFLPKPYGLAHVIDQLQQLTRLSCPAATPSILPAG